MVDHLIPQAAIDFIKQWESFRAEPYQDQAGIWTVGYGDTSGVTADTDPITEEDATNNLIKDLNRFDVSIDAYIHRELNDNQRSAILSLIYNVGVHPIQMTMGKLLNSGQMDAAANEFLKWVFIHINERPFENDGLKNRRKAERELFLTPIKEN